MVAEFKLDASPVATSKVVSFHAFAHEEQVKNTDQGNLAVGQRKARKNPLPASDLAKLPKQTAQAQEQAALLQKAQAALATIHTEMSKLASASGNQPAYNAWNQSILMLYTAFAENQMNQNGLIMNGWEAQQQAQNVTLQETAQAEADNANKVTNTPQASVSWWKVALCALAVVVTVALIATGVGAVVGAGGIGAAIAIASDAGISGLLAESALSASTVAYIGAGAGAAAGTAMYLGANAGCNSYNNGGSLNGSGGLVDVANVPNQTLLQEIAFLNQFLNTIAQKTNNAISTGSQTNLVNASSNDTQLGQQAAQAIQAMGQVMQTPVSH